MDNHSQQIADIAKAAPPLTISGMTIAGFPLSDWVLMATAVYTVLKIILVVRSELTARRLGDPACAKDCPVGQMHIQGKGRSHDKH